MRILIIILSLGLLACNNEVEQTQNIEANQEPEIEGDVVSNLKQLDDRISLNLNPMQKQHQLENMRSHLGAVQELISLIANEEFEKASEVAYTQLGSTTEMKLMCASFGNKAFENLGIAFHESADKMSEIIKQGDKKKSLEALANTMNYCMQCHASFRQ